MSREAGAMRWGLTLAGGWLCVASASAASWSCGGGEEPAPGEASAAGGGMAAGGAASVTGGRAGGGTLVSTGGAQPSQRWPEPSGTAGVTAAPRQSDVPLSREAEIKGRAGVVLGSCLRDDGVERNVSYMWDHLNQHLIWVRYGLQAECLASARNGCGAIGDCLRGQSSGGACEQGWSCSGDTATLCKEGRALVSVSCEKLNLPCDPAGECGQEGGELCERNSFTPYCSSDGKPVICDNGMTLFGPNCAKLGLLCRDGACVGPGPACVGGGMRYVQSIEYRGLGCEGNTLLACRDDGIYELDCGGVGEGFRCLEAYGFYGCRLDSECADVDGPILACHGNVLTFCNAGRIQEVDCTELGFTGCGESWIAEKPACLP